MMTIKIYEGDVFDGPGRFELLSSLTTGKPVKFVLAKEDGEVEMVVDHIGRESRDGHSWLITGYRTGDSYPVELYYRTHPDAVKVRGRLKLFKER